MAKSIECAAGIMLKGRKILLCRRADHEKTFPGHWGLPGGKKEDIDLDSRETARREIKEEIGLDFEPSHEFRTFLSKRDGRNFSSTIFLGGHSGRIRLDPEEISDASWFTYEEAKELKLAFNCPLIIEELRKEKKL